MDEAERVRWGRKNEARYYPGMIADVGLMIQVYLYPYNSHTNLKNGPTKLPDWVLRLCI